VNVNFNAAAVAEIPNDATTLADELGQSLSRVRLVQALLHRIEEYYLRVNENLVPEYSDHLSTLNQWVRVQTLAGIEEGLAERVNENGALILRRADGSRIELIAGEVTLIKS
jgi:BirA family biotin operon repressor/biotin-[acetyl-CoA-carboxylase] ligase